MCVCLLSLLLWAKMVFAAPIFILSLNETLLQKNKNVTMDTISVLYDHLNKEEEKRSLPSLWIPSLSQFHRL